MIEWYMAVQIGVALLAGLLCLGLGFAGRVPSDLSLGSIALVTVLLVAQLVVTIVAPLVGNEPRGNLAEFYVYLISAIILPVAGGFWALIERSRWSTIILGLIGLALAVMLYRMGQIWFVQGM
ncbi:hypothetical protein [Rathayibacter soli]|uniref:hypothetical protein n=1 Tax=Rathayibacter soli TaxID=3144168 RepID=UPI0027E3E8E1|nr:hypothetical protein [Glaciibacter superstes]